MRLVIALGCAALAAAQTPQFKSAGGKTYLSQADNADLKALQEKAAASPNDAAAQIALARGYDRLLQFDRSIPIYTKLIRESPGDVQAYRYRGHRYISTRKFPEAVADLVRAQKIAPGSFDVLYHLGLAQYLSGDFRGAADTYGRCLDWRPGANEGVMPKEWRGCAGLDDDSRIAISNWRYAALRRAGQEAEARKLLEAVHEKMQVKENIAYLNALLFYKGERGEEIFDAAKLQGASLMALGYPIANFALMSGNKAKACALFEKLMADPANWAAFGFIAAETDVARGVCR
ncbi:MAG: tetratricopeptide repeat protein [Bryobacteraceae bacterium]|nr:tetratricopeptide repeat protein [Bryobacteraceae bacterium]